ncbi:hypothetical protein [Alkaliphilus sp. B6464]|uniref:hypothetical protein n=1 Tax=Alkaliphilus sp. B6464 TaxID=2731219 RepID=UPI001BA8A8AA|nr:hypothetical protein [Alkaliphilus sp. B6464]QUH21815.1 hypothetical protein HYG84_17925 [Alkaliphilus sp. B6464]
MKYKVEVGSFCTRFIKRTITVHADNETEATEKAINKYIDAEMQLMNYSDFGTPQVDSVEEINS